MTLNGTDNKSFELWVVNYQYGDNKTDKYDSNWLAVGIALKGFEQPWITTDTCLLTWELKSLTDWLQNILTGDAAKLEFIEPSIRFELIDKVNNAFNVRIHLALESKPDWYADEIFSFDLAVDRKQLELSIEKLKGELMIFPGRAGVQLS